MVTEVEPSAGLRVPELPLKSHQRMFYERVPLPAQARRRIQLSDPWDYAALAEGVEAWGFRAIQCRREFMTREEVAEAWFREDYEPIVAALRDVDLVGDATETEAYMLVVSERYLLMRTHEWDTGVLDRVARELR